MRSPGWGSREPEEQGAVAQGEEPRLGEQRARGAGGSVSRGLWPKVRSPGWGSREPEEPPTGEWLKT